MVAIACANARGTCEKHVGSAEGMWVYRAPRPASSLSGSRLSLKNWSNRHVCVLVCYGALDVRICNACELAWSAQEFL